MQTVIITCISSHITIALLFLSVRNIPQHRGADWWIGSSLMLIISYAFLFVAVGDKPGISIDVELSNGDELGIYFLNMSCMLFLYIGSTAFLKQPINIKSYTAIFGSLFAALIYLRLKTDDILLADILFSAYCSITAYLIARQHFRQDSEIRKIRDILAKLCFFLAFHWLNYPFLHNITAVAPLGFLIAVTTSICIFITLAMMVIMRFNANLIASEKRAVYAARHDILTGLHNRYSLDQIFENYAQRSIDHNKSFAVMYIDLDGFKKVNDTYGHKAGDQVLGIIAKRLKNRLSSQETVTRIGGDEFVILSEQMGIADKALTETFMRNLLSRIEHPIVHEQEEYHVSASIGVSLYPQDGKRLDTLLNKADEAMYSVKKSGKNGYAYTCDQAELVNTHPIKKGAQQRGRGIKAANKIYLKQLTGSSLMTAPFNYSVKAAKKPQPLTLFCTVDETEDA